METEAIPSGPASPSEPLLRIDSLTTRFNVEGRAVAALREVSLQVARGQTLGIVGESGSGKSVLGLSIMRLVQCLPRSRDDGTIAFEGRDILGIDDAEMRQLRGNRIAMIFQDPMTSLNPVYTAGDQIAEVFRRHRRMSKREALDSARSMLQLVGIPDPDARMNAYPHQLSGGMKQRVMIAIALACEPSLLIADEPTTALDVSIQSQILSLIADLKRRLGTSMIIVSHDMGVIAETADRVMVMYGGRKVEEGTVEEIFEDARHPYTQALLSIVPRIREADEPQPRRTEIRGSTPSLAEIPAGCPFYNRCDFAGPECTESFPETTIVGPSHSVSCWKERRV